MVESTKVPVKIYWKELPPENDQVKNSLNPNIYNSPGKMINSKFAEAYPKPWLANPKKTNKNIVKEATIKADRPINSKKIKTPLKESNINYNETVTTKNSVTLKDLCKEDKQKVAKLIKELSKFGDEKENAVNKLQEARVQFEKKLKLLEVDKTKAVAKQDELKETILKYQIIIDEIQLKKENKQMEFEKESVKIIKGADGELKQFYILDKANDKAFSDMTSEKSLNDTYAGVFIEQQKQLEMQQESLQQQIKQLQQLQESLLKHPTYQKKLADNNKTDNTPLVANIQTPSQYANSQKLDNYLNNTQESIHSKSLNQDVVSVKSIQENIHSNSFRQGVISETTLENSLQSQNSNCFDNTNKNISQKQVKIDAGLQTDIPSTYDFQQTSQHNKSSNNKDNKSRRHHSETYIKHGAKYSICSDTHTQYARTNSSKVPAQVDYNAVRKQTSSTTSKSNKSVSFLPKTYNTTDERNHYSYYGRKNTKPIEEPKYSSDLLSSLISDEDSSSEEDDINISPFVSSNYKHSIQKYNINQQPISPLKRKHFNRSSMLMLAEGMLPPSTSTSVDQYSLKQSYQPEVKQRSDTNINSRKKATKLSSKRVTLSDTSCRKHGLKPCHCRQQNEYVELDDEENEVLGDIFFVK